MKMNEIYEAPMLEVLNVAVECGFAASPSTFPIEPGEEG